jgi:hypothetical protein
MISHWQVKKKKGIKFRGALESIAKEIAGRKYGKFGGYIPKLLSES